MNEKEDDCLQDLDDVVTGYIRQVSKINRIGDYEQRQLLSQGTKRDIKRVIECNLVMVIGVAKRYGHLTKNGIEFCDMIQEGNMGLLHAVDRYDLSFYTKFSTFAVYHIRDRIVRYIRKCHRQQCDNIDDIQIINEIIDSSVELSVLFTLSYVERKVLSMRWGCEDGECKTEECVGQKIGRSKERCCQIEKKALVKLQHPGRKYLVSEGLEILDI